MTVGHFCRWNLPLGDGDRRATLCRRKRFLHLGKSSQCRDYSPIHLQPKDSRSPRKNHLENPESRSGRPLPERNGPPRRPSELDVYIGELLRAQRSGRLHARSLSGRDRKRGEIVGKNRRNRSIFGSAPPQGCPPFVRRQNGIKTRSASASAKDYRAPGAPQGHTAGLFSAAIIEWCAPGQYSAATWPGNIQTRPAAAADIATPHP